MGVFSEVIKEKRRIRLVALDLDGTVVREDLTIAESTIEAVGRAKRAGLFVVVATGRMFRSAMPHVERLGVTEPVIAYNGALVMEVGRRVDSGGNGPAGGRPLLHRPVPLDVALEVARWCQAKRLTLNVYINDDLHVAQMNESVRYYEHISGVKARAVGDLAALIRNAGEGPTKLLIVGAGDEDQQGLADEIEGRFGTVLHVARSQGRFVEMTHPEATKGKALTWLAGRLGVQPAEVMAVGDSFNDVEMLEFAGIGAAMAAAPEKVRQMADVTVESVEEALERFVF